MKRRNDNGNRETTKSSNRLGELRTVLTNSLIERDGEVGALLLGLVARENVLFVGPPGTAKSQLVTNLTKAMDGANSFSLLLTKFTTPEELFGPIKLTALKQDRYERAIDGYAPTADVVFVDEIWKASSAILNTLLTLFQERRFDNGAGNRLECPLRVAIAASNEWPSTEDGQELGAMFDRFLIRRVVRTISPAGRHKLLYSELPGVGPVVKLRELDRATKQASELPVSDEAKALLDVILVSLSKEGIMPGDRRTRKSVGIARAAAWLDGADEVRPVHLESLQDVLWVDPAQRERCSEIVVRLSNPVAAKLDAILREVSEIVDSATDAASRLAAIKKLEQCEKQAESVAEEGNGRAQKVLDYTRHQRTALTEIALGITGKK